MPGRDNPPKPEVAELDAAAARFRRAEQVMKDRRAELHAAIRAAVGPELLNISEAARRTGYTREYVSKILSD
ncbi:hypothetical protein ACQP1P_38750 [Dactylosporangium sp. CA-052675]|uniref:hypothetical protein n=1 Tax=Dactylosporangium sp. CA-052675 TaxID=3239927 RepID=UPI003D8B48EB